jgi:DNA invertase Pin-like site-specific DNA recombinase
MRTKAAAYLRTDKEDEARQRLAISAFAKRERFMIAAGDWFRDSGAAPIDKRPGFGRLLDRLEEGGISVVIVENAGRFAREIVDQELCIIALIKRGVRIITITGEDLSVSDDPVKKLMRGVAGIFAQLDASTHQEKGRRRMSV